jgi:hypothetical protein
MGALTHKSPARHALQRPERIVGFRKIVENAGYLLEITRAGFRQAHAARGAVEKPHVQVRLQLADILADGRGRKPHPARGFREGAPLHGLAKYPDGLQLIHDYSP